jgi:CHAT domain-containing protein
MRQKKTFLENSKTANLLHYHGHADLAEDGGPLGHELSFAGNTEDEQFLTAKEVFSNAFNKSSHLTMIACSSGLARQAVGDEVMRLVSALLHAGVSSTISTLWDTDSLVGNHFSRNFYDGWAGNLASGWTTVDLARAF